HEEAPVLLGLERVLARGRVERRPAAARVVLRLGAEELRAAARAAVDAVLEHVVVLVRERSFGALLAQDAVRLRRQLAPPLLAGLRHLGRQADSSLRRFAAVQSAWSDVRYAAGG